MTGLIPTPRRPDDTHWCSGCQECPSCDAGRNHFPVAWIPHIDWRTGVCTPLCTLCDGAAVLCPALTGKARA